MTGNTSSGFGKDFPWNPPRVSAAMESLTFDLPDLTFVMALTLRGETKSPGHSFVS